jgi:hypothetical protein
MILLKRMVSDIEAESKEGEGSGFVIVFPSKLLP